MNTEQNSQFPRIIIGSAMLWSTPHSARFRPGFVPSANELDPPGGWTTTASSFFGNAPLVPSDSPDDECLDDLARFPKAYFEDLANSGIDAIDHCFFDHLPCEILLDTAKAAQASGTGIKVFPMMDFMPKRGPSFLTEIWQNRELRDHPNMLKLEDGRIVVITFGHHGAEVWRKRLETAAAVGGRYFVIGDTCLIVFEHQSLGESFVAAARNETAPLDGLYCFADWSPRELNLLGRMKEIAESYNPPKIAGGSVVPGYIGATRQGIIHDLRGTEKFRLHWMDVIARNPGFVYLATLNDYTESTEQDCSANSTYAFIDLNAYFGERWRTGKWPVPTSARAFLSYRKTVSEDEAVEVELVLLRPDIAGDENPENIAGRFHATATLTPECGEPVVLDAVDPEVLPGHLVWRFWLKGGLAGSRFAVPGVKISVDGKPVSLPEGPAAAFGVLGNGESLCRRWLHVPLHRICPGVHAQLKVAEVPGRGVARQIQIEGIAWNEVSCGVLERAADSLSPALSAKQLEKGFFEEINMGPGWCPMAYRDGLAKRSIIDQIDRYTAVVRMKDNTFVYPAPAVNPPPDLIVNDPYVDPATVMDLVIAPGNKLLDRGWMRRDLVMPVNLTRRPTVHYDKNLPYLHFDGKNSIIVLSPSKNENGRKVGNLMDLGSINMPPGPVTLELLVRPLDTSVTQTIFDSSEPVLSIVLAAGGTLRLIRWNQHRKPVMVTGTAVLETNRWTCVTAVFTGHSISLYVNGKPDGSEVPVHGLRSDNSSSIGGPSPWAEGLCAEGMFHGDIAKIRILQRYLTPAEIADSCC